LLETDKGSFHILLCTLPGEQHSPPMQGGLLLPCLCHILRHFTGFVLLQQFVPVRNLQNWLPRQKQGRRQLFFLQFRMLAQQIMIDIDQPQHIFMIITHCCAQIDNSHIHFMQHIAHETITHQGLRPEE